MRRPAPLLLFLGLCLLLPGAVPPAAAQAAAAGAPPAAAPQVTPQQAQQLLGVLQDPRRRAQFTATLEALTRALPPAGPETPPAATPAPPPAPQAALPLKPDSLGLQVLDQVSDWASAVSGQVTSTSQALGDLPLLWVWLRGMATDPGSRALALDAAWKLALVVGCAVAASLLMRRLVNRPIRMIEAHVPPDGAAPEADEAGHVVEDAEGATRHRLGRAWALLRKLPAMLARLVLDLLPTGAFLLVGNVLLGTRLGQPDITGLVILHGLNACVILSLVLAVTRLLVLPSSRRLRLLRVDDAAAAYAETWVRRIAIVVVFGSVLAQSALLFGLYRNAQDELFKLVMLVAHVLLVIVVLQCRDTVARRIRLRRDRHGLLAMLLDRLASVWHWVAIFYIMALWVVWAVEVRNGLSRLFHFFFVTSAVLVAARLAAIVLLGGLYRALHVTPEVASRYPGLESRAGRYLPLARALAMTLIGAATAAALLEGWGFDALTWFRVGLGSRLLSAVVTVIVTVLVAVAVWEAANAGLDRQVSHLAADGHTARVARLRTLAPILQTSLLIAILVIIGLTVLSEIGVNIAPLLAGAGIVGVALGFGSQKLVQDLITGLFLLLENAMQVGDFVTVSGLSGKVEHLSIRTIRLRAGDGSVHIIPFSSVTSVTNTNRGVGNAAVSVTVAYAEDTDRVGEAMKAVADEMRDDPAFADAMSDGLALWGVDKVDGATATLVGQIPCTDSGRWGVQREFNRRIQKRFQELGIRMALPAQSVVLHQDLPVPPPAARLAGPGPTAATQAESPAPAALGHES